MDAEDDQDGGADRRAADDGRADDPGSTGLAEAAAKDGDSGNAGSEDIGLEGIGLEGIGSDGIGPEGTDSEDTASEDTAALHAAGEPDAAQTPVTEAAAQSQQSPNGSVPDLAEHSGRSVSSGIGCAALVLPLTAVVGAVLCFAAGILSTVSGCKPNGSALCSANGPWFVFALPLFVSPIVAAAAAIAAVTVRRHRSSWLAVGYGVVFISVIVGLASASTGSN